MAVHDARGKELFVAAKLPWQQAVPIVSNDDGTVTFLVRGPNDNVRIVRTELLRQ
jgi:hypothetical protein